MPLPAASSSELFFTGILENKYLGHFGRQKMRCLQKGIEEIEEGRLTIQDLLRELHEVGREEPPLQPVC